MSPKKNKRRPQYSPVQRIQQEIIARSRSAAGLIGRVAQVVGALAIRVRPRIIAAVARSRILIVALRRWILPTLRRILPTLRRTLPLLRRAALPVYKVALRIYPWGAKGVRYLDPRIVRLEHPDRHNLHSAIISGSMIGVFILAITLAACT